MRNLIGVALWALLSVHLAVASQVVNLDAPGALEALKRDKPAHYAKVVEMMEKVQAVPYDPHGRRDLRLDVQKPDPTRRQIETSFPAKTRLTMFVDDVQYNITVTYTKNPAKLVPAK